MAAVDARPGRETAVAELYIASVVVHATPGRVARVREEIAMLAGACVHAASAGGKLVVTLEAGSAEAMTGRMTGIHRIEGVLGVALVYQCAESLAAMNEEMPDVEA
jgi:nitrate reductase NapD